jgi:hypothetical protein
MIAHPPIFSVVISLKLHVFLPSAQAPSYCPSTTTQFILSTLTDLLQVVLGGKD